MYRPFNSAAILTAESIPMHGVLDPRWSDSFTVLCVTVKNFRLIVRRQTYRLTTVRICYGGPGRGDKTRYQTLP